MSDEFDQLFEMAVAAKPYLRDTLERMRADIVTIDSPSARKGFGDFLRKVLTADHSEALTMMQERGNAN